MVQNDSIYRNAKRVSSRLFRLVFLLSAVIVGISFPNPISAQVTWTQGDIGSTGATGTYSYSSGTHTVGGAGSIIGGTSDSFCYVSSPTSGNVEIIGRVNTQTNTNPYAVAGFMMRSSLDADATNAFVSVSPSNGVNFSSRDGDGSATNTTYGPTLTVPTYLRLVRSGNSFSGYQSTDGIKWTLIGKSTLTNMPNSFYVGFAVCSYSFGNLSIATFDKVSLMTSVPQRSANLTMWLRSDVGVTTSSGAVTNWADQSGNGYNATQSSGSNRPTLTTNAVNGLPAISFNGSSQFLNLPSGFSNFSEGVSIYIVHKPGATMNYPIDIGNGGSSNDISIYGASGYVYFYAYGTSYSLTTSSSSGYTPGVYQLSEVVHNGTDLATLYKNGSQTGSGTAYPFNNVTRSTNRIGQYGGGSYFYSTDIAEMIILNKGSTDAERASIESYIYSKYNIGTQPTLAAPNISPDSGVFASSPQTVTITGDSGANIYYTTDGSTPTSSSTPYTNPLSISSTTTIKAIAVKQFFTDSPVSTSIIQIDPTTEDISKTGLMMWLKSDIGVTTSGSDVTDWVDLSGNGNDATQTSGSNRPTLVSNAIAGLPAIDFSGTSQWMNLPSGFADLSSGASIFVVTKPTTTPSGYLTWLDLGNAGSDHLTLYQYSSSQTQLWAYNGASSSSIASPSGYSVNQYQLIEAIHSGSASGSLYKDGVLGVTGSLNNLNTVTRSSNKLGAYFTGIYFQGEIAEVLFYNRALNSSERQAIEQYVNNRYQFVVKPPTISPGSGMYANVPFDVTMSADPGATIYFTTDGSTPTSGSTPYSTPITVSSDTVLRAIAITSWGTSTVSDAYIQIKSGGEFIPKTGLQLWLKSDFGVFTSGSNVTQWSDISGNGFHATQSNGTDQPSLTNDIANGNPGISFNGTSHFLELPAGFADFTSGASIFAVSRPTGMPSATPVILDFSTGSATNNNLTLEEAPSTTIRLKAYNGTTSSSLSSTTGLTQNKFQVFEAVHDGAGSGTIYTNTTQGASGSLQNLLNINRTTNKIGRSGGSTPHFYQGDLAELLVYNRGLTNSERTNLESYFMQKYQLGNAAPTAPIFSLNTSSLQEATQVAITAEPTSTIYYTLDGSSPTTSSTAYTNPINISFTQTLKAIAVFNGATSSTTSATYTLDSTKWPAPHATDTTPLHLNLQLPTTAIPQ